MTQLALEERATAGKRIRVESLWNGQWLAWHKNYEDKRHGDLADLIQAMADDGYNFAGKIDEYIPTGTIAAHTEDFLFIKAEHDS